jgi:hypothetical protein
MPVTLAAATSRQRRDRSRPSGSSSAGKVTPRAMGVTQFRSPTTAFNWAASGSGRCSASSWSTRGAKGVVREPARPAPAYSQPIGLAGRRKVRTSPTVAKPREKVTASTAPAASTRRVRGRTTATVTARPAARNPKVASHKPQASTVLR